MPELKHHDEFEEILAKYNVSEHSKQVLQGLKLVLLLAPTSSGRNTIINQQLSTGQYYYIISDTTREPRFNDGVMEENGKQYWFRKEEDVLADLKKGEYLEAELIHNQQVSGISIRELEKARNAQKIAIKDIDLAGMHNVVRAKPDTVAIMMLPPSFEEWMDRLTHRGRMRPDELKRRLQTAEKILEDGSHQNYYDFVISENIEQSGAIIDAILQGKTNPHQGRGPGVLQQLQSGLQDKLSNLHHSF
jgi:guanylate kinase